MNRKKLVSLVGTTLIAMSLLCCILCMQLIRGPDTDDTTQTQVEESEVVVPSQELVVEEVSTEPVVYKGNGIDTVDYVEGTDTEHTLEWNCSKYRAEYPEEDLGMGRPVDAMAHAFVTLRRLAYGEDEDAMYGASLSGILNEQCTYGDTYQDDCGNFTVELSTGGVWVIYWNLTESYARYLCQIEDYPIAD